MLFHAHLHRHTCSLYLLSHTAVTTTAQSSQMSSVEPQALQCSPPTHCLATCPLTCFPPVSRLCLPVCCFPSKVYCVSVAPDHGGGTAESSQALCYERRRRDPDPCLSVLLNTESSGKLWSRAQQSSLPSSCPLPLLSLGLALKNYSKTMGMRSPEPASHE